jgi:hypothetical protein
MSIYHRVDTTCQKQKYVLQQQCLFITELIPRVRHSTFGTDMWYQLCDKYKLLLEYVLLCLTRGINSVINRHCSYNVYLSQSWYHVSDTKICITTTMSIYHRVDATCQIKKYVLQQDIVVVIRTFVSDTWYQLCDK